MPTASDELSPGEQAAAGPLAGYRVLDLSGPIGVHCTKLLADLGADVVRVEPPSGDPMRRLPPFLSAVQSPELLAPDSRPGLPAPTSDPISLYYLHMNTSKRAVALDLADPDDRERFLGLVDAADVLVESLRPGELASLGLDYAFLRKRNPGLVLTSITPFGQSGPYSQFRGCDLVGQAMGGVMSITGYPDGTPLRLAGEQGYHSVAIHACAGTLLALYREAAQGLHRLAAPTAA